MVTIQSTDLTSRAGPAYRALADVLAEAIDAGRLPPGERLPPQRDLAWRLAVTVGTVGRAYDLLTQRGLVRGEVGRGTFVLESAARRDARHNAPVGEVLDLTANFPAPIPAQARLADLLPFAETAAQLAGELLHYPPAAGIARHREAAARWLRAQGVEGARADTVIITTGAEGALATSLLALARPGDPVLVEPLTYSGLKTLVTRLGLRLEPVATDEAGMLPDAMAAAARHTGARLVVLSPTLNNPTAALMPLERRQEIVEAARRASLVLIEDEVYGPLVPDRPPPFACLAPERSVYLTSLSKFLAPGLRLGLVTAPRDHALEIAAAQADLCLGTSPLAGELFARCEATGLLAEALIQQQAEMRARQAMAAGTLTGFAYLAQPTGLHLWLQLTGAWSSAEAALALARAGVLVAPAERFFLGRGGAPQAIRLSLSAPPTRTHLQWALTAVATTLGTPVGMQRPNT